MIEEKLIEAFTRLGFDEYRAIETPNIIFSEDVITQCAMNTCGNFGKNHACPPRSGTKEERESRVLQYRSAFLLCRILPIGSRQKMTASMALLDDTHKKLRQEFSDEDVLVLGAGPCRLCERCAALEDQPCRFPGKTQYSMEGNGIDVVRMSREQKMTYNAGGEKVGFFSLVVYGRDGRAALGGLPTIQ